MGVRVHQIPADLQKAGDGIRSDAPATEKAGHEEGFGGMHGAHVGDKTLDGRNQSTSLIANI